MATILIAGCGDLGCLLGETLAQEGHTIYGLRRHTDDLPESIHPIQSDLSHSLPKLPETVDYVFYMASAGKYKDAAYYQAYVLGVKNTLNALGNKNVKRFFFISSTSVFGQSEGELVNEESPTSGKNFSTRRLLEGEHLVRDCGFASTIVRFGGIYGPGRTHLIDLVTQGKAHCMEDVWSNRIHSIDCVGILKHLMELDMTAPQKVDGLYIGVDNQPTLSCEVYDWLAEQLSVPDVEHSEPTENSRMMRSNKRLSNAKIRASGYNFIYPTYQDGYIELLEA
ncbi:MULTISPECIES: NAD-dependent epimerase/dehydratase family protein [Thiomicrorhabdus]|uniref:NAD-dependent epimerase/dehydratase family protein n=1 Tax=Thiomicrorhabdus heinhorstiae TaxID=2748010 RepID=A0ABS0BWK1_9GAMM|nr:MULTISPECIES: NAD-dependent epimerase/dehydratase family protein [Thiomicrorhabdus]MBF6058192.1 NAD-dependent epimerase/dehydratase family protein [Thiomicrorhabdus heinhorstiae]